VDRKVKMSGIFGHIETCGYSQTSGVKLDQALRCENNDQPFESFRLAQRFGVLRHRLERSKTIIYELFEKEMYHEDTKG
jgi:hypothetical protein